MGWADVGTDHDAAAFAVASIRRWWHGAGHTTYPGARHLVITPGVRIEQTRRRLTKLRAERLLPPGEGDGA